MFTFENIIYGVITLIFIGIIGLNICWYFGLFKE